MKTENVLEVLKKMSIQVRTIKLERLDYQCLILELEKKNCGICA